MDAATKERLARVHDKSKAAQQMRYAAVISAVGISKTDLAKAIGQTVQAITNSSTPNAANNPSASAMAYLWEHHAIDTRFILYGYLPGLPSDVSDRIFYALSKMQSEWD